LETGTRPDKKRLSYIAELGYSLLQHTEHNYKLEQHQAKYIP